MSANPTGSSISTQAQEAAIARIVQLAEVDPNEKTPEITQISTAALSSGTQQSADDSSLPSRRQTGITISTVFTPSTSTGSVQSQSPDSVSLPTSGGSNGADQSLSRYVASSGGSDTRVVLRHRHVADNRAVSPLAASVPAVVQTAEKVSSVWGLINLAYGKPESETLEQREADAKVDRTVKIIVWPEGLKDKFQQIKADKSESWRQTAVFCGIAAIETLYVGLQGYYGNLDNPLYNAAAGVFMVTIGNLQTYYNTKAVADSSIQLAADHSSLCRKLKDRIVKELKLKIDEYVKHRNFPVDSENIEKGSGSSLGSKSSRESIRREKQNKIKQEEIIGFSNILFKNLDNIKKAMVESGLTLQEADEITKPISDFYSTLSLHHIKELGHKESAAVQKESAALQADQKSGAAQVVQKISASEISLMQSYLNEQISKSNLDKLEQDKARGIDDKLKEQAENTKEKLEEFAKLVALEHEKLGTSLASNQQVANKAVLNVAKLQNELDAARKELESEKQKVRAINVQLLEIDSSISTTNENLDNKHQATQAVIQANKKESEQANLDLVKALRETTRITQNALEHASESNQKVETLASELASAKAENEFAQLELQRKIDSLNEKIAAENKIHAAAIKEMESQNKAELTLIVSNQAAENQKLHDLCSKLMNTIETERASAVKEREAASIVSAKLKEQLESIVNKVHSQAEQILTLKSQVGEVQSQRANEEAQKKAEEAQKLRELQAAAKAKEEELQKQKEFEAADAAKKQKELIAAGAAKQQKEQELAKKLKAEQDRLENINRLAQPRAVTPKASNTLTPWKY